MRKSWQEAPWILIIRATILLPVFVVGFAAAKLGFVGFATPKIPRGIARLTEIKLRQRRLFSAIKLSELEWFKIVEHYVVANFPNTFGRMYNYLMIYGLLRSGALLLVASFWLEINQIVVTRFNITVVTLPSYIVLHHRDGYFGILFALWVAIGATYFCYVKFNRRYFEEAMLGFSLREDI